MPPGLEGQQDSETLDNQNIPDAEQALPEMPVVAEPEEEADPSSFFVEAKFTDDERDELMRIASTELSKIKLQYDEIQWFSRCESADNEYEGKTSDYEDEDAPNIKLLLTTVTIDIVAHRAYRQTWQPDPFVLMDAEFEDEKKEDILTQRQDISDFTARKKSGHWDNSLQVYKAAGRYGVAILKPFYTHESEWHTKKKFYRVGNQDDIKAFEEKYKKKLMKGSGKEFDEWNKLKSGFGNPVVKVETDQEVIYHGAKMYRVDWKKFFARPDIKDFRKHTAIFELFSYNWYEVESNVNSGFWDNDAVDELKEQAGDLYWQKDYDFYTSIIQFDRKGDGKLQRYLVTFEAKTKKIVRAIYYPYKECFYITFWVFERDDTWIGYSITDRMSDIAMSANETINSYCFEQDLAHTPLIISSGSQAGDWQIKLGAPNLLKVSLDNIPNTNSQLMQYRMETPSTDRIQYLGWVLMYIAVLMGIDLIQSAGATNPQEKRPTNARTQMKLQSSQIRVEDMIITLQKGDAKVVELVEFIEASFPEKVNDTKMNLFIKGNQQEVDMAILQKPVRYIIAGSSMSFDKKEDLQIVMGTIDFLSKFFPEIIKDGDCQKALASAVFSNSQGTIAKIKDTLLRPIIKKMEVAKQKEAELKAVVEKMTAEGRSKEEIAAFLQSLQGGGQPKPPMTGQPPQGAMPPPPMPQGAPVPPMGGR